MASCLESCWNGSVPLLMMLQLLQMLLLQLLLLLQEVVLVLLLVMKKVLLGPLVVLGNGGVVAAAPGLYVHLAGAYLLLLLLWRRAMGQLLRQPLPLVGPPPQNVWRQGPARPASQAPACR